jgi:menaquinone reductase, molybdopterin-binding-like subunit
MKFERRDLLKVAGGAGVGFMFTPVPWRLVGDSALWTQNWSWIPRLPHGERTEKATACTLCPSGCAVKARLVGGVPVSLVGSTTPLCPAGLCGHHLAYHPARLRTAMHRGETAKVDDVRAAGKQAVDRVRQGGGNLAVLDLRPGRTASLLYRKHLTGIPGAMYLTAGVDGSPTLKAVERMLAKPATLAFDLAHTRTLVSFSTPVLENWGTPGRLWTRRGELRVWQAEARQSGTAITADRWLRILPHSEAALAIGLIAALDGDAAVLKEAARRCGMAEAEIAEAARELLANGPAVAVADGDPIVGAPSHETLAAVAALNVRLGAVGREGGIVARRETPAPKDWKAVPQTALDDVRDGSIAFLYIDDSAPGAVVPWKLIAPKMAAAEAIVMVSSWTRNGLAPRATYAVPAAGYMETMGDAAVAADAPSAAFAVSAALIPAGEGLVEPVDFFGDLVASDVKLAAALEQRAGAIHAARRGGLVKAGEAEAAPVSGIAKTADFWQALQDGGRWVDAPAATALKAPPAVLSKLSFGEEPKGIPVIAHGWRGAEVSPLMSKLWIESDLKPAARLVTLNPETARSFGLEAGDRARLESNCGSCDTEVQVDAAVAPGVIEMAAGHAFLELCQRSSGAWKAPSAVKVVRS